jgi:hypothetical protein
MLLVNTNLRHETFPLPQMSGLESYCSLPSTSEPQQTDICLLIPSTNSHHNADGSGCHLRNGDLNCKHVSWNNASVNKNGSTLLSYSLNNAININYPNQPTHFPYNSYPSVLDIALSQRCTTCKPLAIPALSSDHNPIVFKVHLHLILSTPKLSYDYKHANWPVFRSSLDLALDLHPIIQNTTELDQPIIAFTQTIRQEATQAIPVRTTRRNHITLPPNLLYLWKLKNHYRRRHQSTRSPSTHQLYLLLA